jgi:hypothetical protein
MSQSLPPANPSSCIGLTTEFLRDGAPEWVSTVVANDDLDTLTTASITWVNLSLDRRALVCYDCRHVFDPRPGSDSTVAAEHEPTPGGGVSPDFSLANISQPIETGTQSLTCPHCGESFGPPE